jgi:hypothetical protein
MLSVAGSLADRFGWLLGRMARRKPKAPSHPASWPTSRCWRKTRWADIQDIELDETWLDGLRVLPRERIMYNGNREDEAC